MRQVNILVENSHNFQLVAFLVDRDDFLKDIDQIRKKLGLKTLMPSTKVVKYLENLGIEAIKNDQRTDTLNRTLENGIDASVSTSTEFVDTIDWLKSKYKKNSHFDMVLAYSILSGEVRNNDLMGTAYLQYLDNEVLKDFQLDGHFQISIVVTRDTRIEEVKKIFNEDVQKLFKKFSWNKTDIFPNIKRNRNWYWKKQEMSWEQLHEYVKRNNHQIELNTLRDAVSNYKEKLQTKLYSKDPPVGFKNS